MYNFTYHVPTRIHFGLGQIEKLTELAESGTRCLLVYGGGSIKKSGIYDKALEILSASGIEVTELSGIEPNPRIQSVRRGVALCREKDIQMILAIGGGSVIDASKCIACGALYEGDPWDLVMNSKSIKAALPVYTVLTLSATGSEMNGNAVISDLTINMKQGMYAHCLKPRMSICDPAYTCSVSRRQTASGTADIMSHTFENYFTSVPGGDLQARFAEGILRTCIHYGPIALAEPDNYEARANLMWCSSNAINGIIAAGAAQAWCVHPMEHELSAFYDITHGEGLAILTPRWMEHILSDETAPKLAEYGRNVWGLTGEDDRAVAKEAIGKTADFFFDTMGMPANLRAVGILDEKNFPVMAEKAARACKKSYVPLTAEDVEAIFRASL